jgi:hypothetical protein
MTEQTPTPEPRPFAEEARIPEEARTPEEVRMSEEAATAAAMSTAAPGGAGADPQATVATEVANPWAAPAEYDEAIAASMADGFAPVGAPPVKERRSFKQWRGERPFWGGLLVLLAGAEILVTEKMPLGVVLHIGMVGLAGLLVPAVLVLCGALLIFSPGQRLFYSILSVLLTLASWVTSNMGGFFLGLLLGMAGSIVAFGWAPNQPPSRRALRRDTHPSTS